MNKRKLGIAAAVAGAAVLAACGVAWWKGHAVSDNGTPYSDARIEAMLQPVLSKQYRSYDLNSKRWLVDIHNKDIDNRFAMAACAKSVVQVKGEWHLLLAMCGDVANQDEASHADSGVIDLYILKFEGDGLKIAASTKGIASGGFGNAGSAEVVRLGKDFFGFRLESGSTHQGITEVSQELWSAKGKSLVRLTEDMPAAEDNSGLADCGEDPPSSADSKVSVAAAAPATGNVTTTTVADAATEQTASADSDTSSAADEVNESTATECYDVKYTLQIDNSDPEKTAYPLRVLETGQRDGKQVRDSETFVFDSKKWHYIVSKGKK